MPDAPPATGPAAQAARAFRQAVEHDRAARGWTYRHYAGELAAVQPHDGTEDQANRRDAIKGLGALLLAGTARSTRLLREAETPNVGPLTLEELDDRVAWLSEHSTALPVGTLLEAADKAAADVAGYLAGRQSGRQRLHLEELAGQLAYFQGREIASHLGSYDVALTHLRVARHYGEQLQHRLLLGSVADMQSTIAFCQGRFPTALQLAQQGQRWATGHTAARLAVDEAKAYAGLGPAFHQQLRQAIDRAERALPQIMVFEPGAALPYGQEMFSYHGATACVRAGDERGAELARQAIGEYEALAARRDPRSSYANLASARLVFAIALVQGDRPDPEQAARLAVGELATPPEFQTHQVKRLVGELLWLLEVPVWRDLPTVRELAGMARSYRPLALPAGPSPAALGRS